MKLKNFDDYKNIKTIKTEYKKVGNAWKKVGTKKYLSSMKNHKYYTSDRTLKFYRGLGGYEKNEYSHTTRGYLPVKNTSISPDKTTKFVTEFDFKNSKKLYDNSYKNYQKSVASYYKKKRK